MTITPHVLQVRALHQLHEHLGERGRGVVVMPCGSGKTLLGRWFAQQLGAEVAIVCVPSLALIPQTLLAWRSDTTWQHRSMIVCSDQTSGRAVTADDLELPAWVRTTVTVSTSEPMIGRFLDRPGPRVIFSTYHSAPRVAAALSRRGVVADLLVCDEAHRLAGRPRSEFRTVLDSGRMPARRRLFLTATPVEAAGWVVDEDVDDRVTAPLSLDDEQLFGPTLYRATFADAIATGRLVDYDVEVLAVDGEPRETPGAQHGVLAAVRAGARRILTFHNRISHAKALAACVDGHRLPGGVRVVAEHLESRHDAQHRAAALARLAEPGPATAAVVASARILTEGVDVPAVETVVFAEPRTSAVDIVQAVGRAMRTAPGKTRGRIVLAVTTPAGVDEDTALGSTAWRHVWVTLRALASMDPRFAARLRHRGNGGHRPGGCGPGLTLTLPAGIDLDRWMLRALDRTGGSWWRCFDLLSAHTRETGIAQPAKGLRRDDVNLSAWVGSQRGLFKRGALSADRVEALEGLPGWAWNARESAWWEASAV